MRNRRTRRMVASAAAAAGLVLALVPARVTFAGGDAALKLESPQLAADGKIPKRHTCEGPDVPPALAWTGVPKGAKSLALIVDDPDAPDPAAPKATWVHWVVYDLPATTSGLAEGASWLPEGTRVGANDWKRARWNGPCPPIGRHRYFFKLYALDTTLGDLHEPTKGQLEAAMKGHVVAWSELVGTYQKGD